MASSPIFISHKFYSLLIFKKNKSKLRQWMSQFKQFVHIAHLIVLQMKVYNDLGKGVLDNAWAGFNTSLFAYGQTGSGKSWSIVGYGANKGM